MAQAEPTADVQINSDLKKIIPKEDRRRYLTLNNGIEIYLRPIKGKEIPKWSGYFIKMASFNKAENGQLKEQIDMSPEGFVRMAESAPEMGDRFNELMFACIEGIPAEDVDQFDYFEIVDRFCEININADFMGKTMARAFGMRG
jgi:hypothetical protein